MKKYQTYIKKHLQNLSKIAPKTFQKSIQKSLKNRSKNLSKNLSKTLRFFGPKIAKNIEFL